MTTLRKSIIIGLTVLGLGATTLAAQAHNHDGQPGRHGQAATTEQMHAKWSERAAARQARLHDLLKLTPAQEAAWGSYTAALRPGVRGERMERAAWAALTAPQRMEKRIGMAKQRVAKMEERLAATNAFYASLTPEQKKLFDENSQRRGGHRMKHKPMG